EGFSGAAYTIDTIAGIDDICSTDTRRGSALRRACPERSEWVGLEVNVDLYPTFARLNLAMKCILHFIVISTRCNRGEIPLDLLTDAVSRIRLQRDFSLVAAKRLARDKPSHLRPKMAAGKRSSLSSGLMLESLPIICMGGS
ncbi:MAG: hypothetical protein M1347_04830, partial [Chloroflexi bacterium]|nr:hypothetical protein [Chloroflexota bacterium]